MLLLLFIFAVATTALPSPLHGKSTDVLYGTDCSIWCVNASDVLQPDIFGSTNGYCTDSRGCDWIWRLRFVPCSLALIDFDAAVGTRDTPWSVIDPATQSTVGFYCSQSDQTVVLEVRPHSGGSIMSWRYRLTTCQQLLSTLASKNAAFVGHETGVTLGVVDWFASGATRLEDTETPKCPSSYPSQLPCKQCFAGAEEISIARNSSQWRDACGQFDTTCSLRWEFCYDACKQQTSSVSINIGPDHIPLSLLNKAASKHVQVHCDISAERGVTVFALTDAISIADLDDGSADFYVAWEYRAAPCLDLFRSPRRDQSFIKHHVAMLRTDNDGILARNDQDSPTLGASTWNGKEQTWSSDFVSKASAALNHKERSLVISLVIVGFCCLVGWGLFVWMLWRQYGWHTQHDGGVRLLESALSEEDNPDADVPGSAARRAIAAAKEKLKTTAEDRTGFLYKDGASQREYEERRQKERTKAQKVVDEAN